MASRKEKGMAYFDIKEIKYKIKHNGGTMQTRYGGSFGFKRPTSQFEAQKIATDWIMKKYPGCTILDLQITYK